MADENSGDYINSDVSDQRKQFAYYNSDYITDAIVILIPKVSKLCKIYQAWYPLEEEERAELDKKAIKTFTSDCLALYEILIKALQCWDEIQDIQGMGSFQKLLDRPCVEGASGAEKGLVVFEYHLEKQLFSIVNELENFLGQLARNQPLRRSSRSPHRRKHSKVCGKQMQLHSVQSLANLLCSNTSPECVSD